MQADPDLRDAGIAVTAGALAALRKTRPWVLFLGIACIIGAVFSGLDALINLAMLFALRRAGGEGVVAPFGTSIAGFIAAEMAVFCLVSILAAVWLLQYAGALRNAVASSERSQFFLDRALAVQGKLWMLLGIFAILGFALGLAAIVLGTVFGFPFPSLQHFPR